MEKYKDNDRIKDTTCAVAKGISLKKIYPCCMGFEPWLLRYQWSTLANELKGQVHG